MQKRVPRVLVVGDMIADTFSYAKKIGVSAETPTIVAEPTHKEHFDGGAGLVCRHLAALGIRATLLSVLDYDLCDPYPFSYDFDIVHADGWDESRKMRFFVDGYKLLQHDTVNKMRHDTESETDLIDRFKEIAGNFDIVVAADNRHGVINKNVARALVDNQKELGYRLFVDSQWSQSEPNHDWYKGCDTIFMNEKEYDYWTKSDDRCLTLNCLEDYLDAHVIVKLGEKGSLQFSEEMIYYAAPKVDVVDTCGAGDAFLAAYISCLDEEREHEKMIFATNYATLSCTLEGTRTPLNAGK